ncbi:MAG TPA: hypothetical protein VHG72_12735 [Polyangia bacterium]|nr:hypothetical protein [Polyangia bacterium]
MAAVSVTVSATPARGDDAQQARELFTQGNTFFDLGQFDKAIDAWQRGYQLKNDPGFLYNIAQAYRTMGDAQKAIFFYKRYLSNAPKAHNRADVEQKIDALQKQVAAQEQNRQLAPPGPLGNPGAAEQPEATPPAAPAPTAPPPVVEPASPVAAPPPGEPSAVVAVTPSVSGERPRHLDFGAALGVDTWSGLQQKADPSFAFTLSGGYTFGRPDAELRFRLGGLFGYTFLKETDGRDSFVWLAVDPMMVIRLAPRARLFADLAFGFMSISGLTANSALLDSSVGTVKGTQTLSLVRLGAGVTYDLTPSLSVFFWPALAESAKKQYFYSSITRVELLAGVSVRL